MLLLRFSDSAAAVTAERTGRRSVQSADCEAATKLLRCRPRRRTSLPATKRPDGPGAAT